MPGKEALISIPYKIQKVNQGSEYFLRISFSLAADQIWAKKGFEIASQQFLIPVNNIAAKIEPVNLNPVKLTVADNYINVTGTGFTVIFDRQSGTFSRLEKNGINIIKSDGGPRLHLWRAPHRNDDMWADRSWVTSGLRELKWTAANVTSEQLDPSTVRISVNLKGEGRNNFIVNHDVVYLITGDGVITASNKISSSNPRQVVGKNRCQNVSR